MTAAVPHLDLDALRTLGARPQAPCDTCAPLKCPGWESLPGSFDRTALAQVGTLRVDGDEDPTVQEHHPHGTHAWSPDAPIAPAFFPYNRCDAWVCRTCGRPFLRYTEYGGYYMDERVRELDTRLLDGTPYASGSGLKT